MQYCGNCRTFFAMWDNRRREAALDGACRCPVCGEEEDVAPAAQCRGCGEFFPPDETEGGLCPGCRAHAEQLYIGFWLALPQAYRDYILDTDFHPADGRSAKKRQGPLDSPLLLEV